MCRFATLDEPWVYHLRNQTKVLNQYQANVTHIQIHVLRLGLWKTNHLPSGRCSLPQWCLNAGKTYGIQVRTVGRTIVFARFGFLWLLSTSKSEEIRLRWNEQTIEAVESCRSSKSAFPGWNPFIKETLVKWTWNKGKLPKEIKAFLN